MLRANFLKGEKVHLRGIVKDDIEHIQTWSTDISYMRQLDTGVALPIPSLAIERDLQGILDGRNKNDVVLIICLPDDNQPIGFVALDGIQWHHGSASLAIGIGKAENRGKGYGGEAIRLFMDFAFNELNLYRIGLTVFEYNTGAKALYERLGFQYEGNARQFMQRDGRRWDMLFYGILRPEWQALYADATK